MTTINKTNFFFVFDVKSVGLHGEAFAVAWVVIDKHGNIQEEKCISCLPGYAQGLTIDRIWITENIPVLDETHRDPTDVRQAFWDKWIEWKEKGALLVADCVWPVEARFLCKCIDDNLRKRCWDGLYPLIDLGSILFALGMDPVSTFPRKHDEEPAHHPLADAKQSARILVEELLSI